MFSASSGDRDVFPRRPIPKQAVPVEKIPLFDWRDLEAEVAEVRATCNYTEDECGEWKDVESRCWLYGYTKFLLQIICRLTTYVTPISVPSV